MRIKCLTTFMDGADRFEAGDVRTVDDGRASVFVALGWAKPEGGTANPTANGGTTLAVQDGTHAAEATNG